MSSVENNFGEILAENEEVSENKNPEMNADKNQKGKNLHKKI